MKTLIIEIKDNKALLMLKEMEKQHLISINESAEQNTYKHIKLSSRFAGKLSAQTAAELQQQVSKSRDEWNRGI